MTFKNRANAPTFSLVLVLISQKFNNSFRKHFIMGRHIKSERLEKARPIVMPSTLIFCKLNLQKLYASSRRLHLAHWDEQLEYPEYIHRLWKTMLTNPALKKDAKKLEEMLGNGDAIQLLSDIIQDHQAQLSNS